MREILFRAKNLYSNEWVDGFLVASKCNTYPDGFEMITYQGINHDELDDYQPDFLSFHVDPETIGQFTEKTVKNGKVFDGDILKSIDGIFLVRWDEEKSAFVMRFLEYPFETLYLEEMWDDAEIIGNIHDNPELLENLKSPLEFWVGMW